MRSEEDIRLRLAFLRGQSQAYEVSGKLDLAGFADEKIQELQWVLNESYEE